MKCAYKDQGTYIRCIKEEIHNVCNNPEQIAAIHNRYLFLQKELDKLTQNTTFTAQITNTPYAKSQSKYRDYIQNITKPYKHWHYQGKRAKNFRFITEALRRETLSLQEKQDIAHLCQNHNWTITQDLLNDLHKNNHYPTGPTLKNINRSKTIPTYPTHMTLVMDWTTQDTENVNLTNNNTAYDLLVDQTHVIIQIPEKIQAYHVCKPSFVMDDDDILYCMFPYKQETKTPQQANGIGGYDWGKVKPVSCAAVYDDGTSSEQYIATRETEHLRECIDESTALLHHLDEKQDRINALLEGHFDWDLLNKWMNIEHEKRLIRNKRSRQREHYACLVARDIVRGFMIEAGVDELHFEGLSLFDRSSWFYEFGLIIDDVCDLCEENGFVALPVSANLTSHRDPVSGERVCPDENREVVTSCGVLDRDYMASLNIACSHPVRKKKSSRHDVTYSGSGVDGEHVRRVHPVKRKKVHKERVKASRSVADKEVLEKARVERRERVRAAREAFYGRVREREVLCDVLGVVSGQSITVSDSVMAKDAVKQELPSASNGTLDKTIFLLNFANHNKV